MSPRVTVNLGLRYEYISMPNDELTNTNTTGGLAGKFNDSERWKNDNRSDLEHFQTTRTTSARASAWRSI